MSSLSARAMRRQAERYLKGRLARAHPESAQIAAACIHPGCSYVVHAPSIELASAGLRVHYDGYHGGRPDR